MCFGATLRRFWRRLTAVRYVTLQGRLYWNSVQTNLPLSAPSAGSRGSFSCFGLKSGSDPEGGRAVPVIHVCSRFLGVLSAWHTS